MLVEDWIELPDTVADDWLGDCEELLSMLGFEKLVDTWTGGGDWLVDIKLEGPVNEVNTGLVLLCMLLDTEPDVRSDVSSVDNVGVLIKVYPELAGRGDG